MAVCEDCRQEMTGSSSCTHDLLVLVDVTFLRPRHEASGPVGRCPDCGVLGGGIHHLGCGVEPCPRCDHQLISCGCARQHVTLENEFGEWAPVVVPSNATSIPGPAAVAS